MKKVRKFLRISGLHCHDGQIRMAAGHRFQFRRSRLLLHIASRMP